MGLEHSFTTEKAWRDGPGIQDGHDVERAVFGLVTEKIDDHMPFKEAVIYAKEHQPSVFSRSDIAKELRKQVAERCHDKSTAVKLFTAVGSPLDVYHGVDAFFEQGERRVTVDITLREKEYAKADVVIRATLDEDGDVRISETELQQAVEKAAELLTVN